MKYLKFILFFILGLVLGAAGLYFYLKNYSSGSNQTNQINLPEAKCSGIQVEDCPKLIVSNVPILMYHHIDTSPPSSQADLYVSLDNFKEQMSYMNQQGYSTTTLDKLFPELEGKKFIITIDDGYKDAIENALPILKGFNFQATVFIITNNIGKGGYLTWDDIKILKNESWTIGSHTLSHPNLTNIKTTEANKEIIQSKQILELKLNTSIDFFCYPAGKFNQETAEMVKNAGYKAAVTTQEGKTNIYSDIYQLKRIRVNGGELLSKFIEKLQ